MSDSEFSSLNKLRSIYDTKYLESLVNLTPINRFNHYLKDVSTLGTLIIYLLKFGFQIIIAKFY